MLTADFNYVLPKELIAQYPSSERDASRLLVLDPAGSLVDSEFKRLPDFLRPGDLIVLNDTRVIPARLYAKKDTGGKVEIMLERIIDEKTLLVQLRAGKALKTGALLHIDDKNIFKVAGRQDDLFLLYYEGEEKLSCLLDDVGHMPLPPYINRDDESLDRERYQTVYSSNPGAVAAPTAGLHFTETILASLKLNDIDNVRLTLHVGAGTFQPVRVDDLTRHRMHKEYANVPCEAVEKINDTRKKGGRIVAVGTTVVRSLETAAREGALKPFEGDTDIFIYPGFKFRVVDMLLTNFHLPESTLLMLVCAFAGKDSVMEAYEHAITQKYRFYSYGDAMLLSRNDAV